MHSCPKYDFTMAMTSPTVYLYFVQYTSCAFHHDQFFFSISLSLSILCNIFRHRFSLLILSWFSYWNFRSPLIYSIRYTPSIRISSCFQRYVRCSTLTLCSRGDLFRCFDLFSFFILNNSKHTSLSMHTHQLRLRRASDCWATRKFSISAFSAPLHLSSVSGHRFLRFWNCAQCWRRPEKMDRKKCCQIFIPQVMRGTTAFCKKTLSLWSSFVST